MLEAFFSLAKVITIKYYNNNFFLVIDILNYQVSCDLYPDAKEVNNL